MPPHSSVNYSGIIPIPGCLLLFSKLFPRRPSCECLLRVVNLFLAPEIAYLLMVTFCLCELVIFTLFPIEAILQR